MNQILDIAQIVVGVLLAISILLQQGGGSLGSAFGGSGESYTAKRGMEKNLLWVSVILTTVFILLSLINFLS